MRLVWLLVLAACGRIDFADVPPLDGGARDGDAGAELACAAGGCPVMHGFAKRFGSPIVDFGFDLAPHPSGGVTFTGLHTGSGVDFGGGTLPNAGSHDVMIVTYDANGTHVASYSAGGPGIDEGYGVRVAADGSLFVAGRAANGVSFGGAPLPSEGGLDGVFARLTANGGHTWSHSAGGTSDDGATQIAIDSATNSYISGTFTQSIMLGSMTLPSAGAADAYVVSYGPLGDHRWSRTFGGTGTERGADAVYEPTTNTVYVSGDFSASVDFGTGVVTSAGGTDGFVAALDASTGATRWVITWGGASGDGCNGVAIDAQGNVYAGAYFSSSLDFDGRTLTSAGDNDILLFSATPSGAVRWATTHGGPARDRIIKLDVGMGGEVVAGGVFGLQAVIGDVVLMSAGDDDMFLFATTTSGTSLWARGFGDMGTDQVHGVVIDAQHRVFATGGFSGTVDFGGGPLTSAGNIDTFLLRLDPEYL